MKYMAIPQVLVEGGVDNSRRVLGVLSGGDVSEDLLKRWAATAEVVIAADAGADLLLRVDEVAHLVIGDMDSVSPRGLTSARQSLAVEDEQTTDCDKLLAHVAGLGHPAVTLIGVEGDLPDHVLAILHSAARSDLDVRLAYRRGLGWIASPSLPRKIKTLPGRRLSLLNLERCEGVTMTGCHWPLHDAVLSLADQASVSNRTEDNEITVTIGKGKAFLFIEFSSDELPVW